MTQKSLTLMLLLLITMFVLSYADSDEISDDGEFENSAASIPAPPPTSGRRHAQFDIECKKKFGEYAEHDGSTELSCTCRAGFVPVNGVCVDAKNARKAALGEQSLLPLYFVGAFFLILAALVGRWAYSQGHEAVAPRDAPRAVDAPQVVAGGAARRTAMARMRARRQAGGGGSDEESEDGSEDGDAGDGKRLGKKKLAKLEAKEERRAAQEAIADERKKRQEREALREEERREAERAKQAEKAAAEEEERRQREEMKKKEEEEFDKWKDMFETAEGGAQADDDLQENQGMLQEFIDHLKNKKIAALDEVAGVFKLKSQEVINRVEGLEAMGRITGLLDDRGKFIYITLEEMESVAKWIRRQGRVGIADLAAESNRLVDLQPRDPDPVPDPDALAQPAAA